MKALRKRGFFVHLFIVKKIILFLFFVIILCAHSNLLAQNCTFLGFYSINSSLHVELKGNYAFIGNNNTGFDVVDASNPSNPILASTGLFSTPFTGVTGLKAKGNYLYVGTSDNFGISKFWIFDIANPLLPIQLSETYISNSGLGVFGIDIGCGDSLAILAAPGEGDGVIALNIADKQNPFIYSSILFSITNYGPRDVRISGNYAYVVDGNGFKIINISDLYNMSLVSTYSGDYVSIDINGDLAYLGKLNNGGFDEVDISDKFNPQLLYSVSNLGGSAAEVKYNNCMLYLSADYGEFYLYDVNYAPIQIAYYNAGIAQCFDVDFKDSLIFLTWVNGLIILKNDTSVNCRIPSDGCVEMFTPEKAPNVFSPNDDGYNDLFQISGLNKGDKVEIYNRWGIKIFEFSGKNDGWDGFTTSGEKCPYGVYYYTTDFVDKSSKYKTYSGFIHLIK